MATTDELKKRAKISEQIDEYGPEFLRSILGDNPVSDITPNVSALQKHVDAANAAKAENDRLTNFDSRSEYGIPLNATNSAASDTIGDKERSFGDSEYDYLKEGIDNLGPQIKAAPRPAPQPTAADDIYGTGKTLVDPSVVREEEVDNFNSRSVPLKVEDNSSPVDLTRPNTNAGIPPEFANPIDDLSKYIARPAEPEINQVLNPATSQLDTSDMKGTDESGGVYPQEIETPLNQTAEQIALDRDGAAGKLALVGGANEQAPLEIPQAQTQAPVDRYDQQLDAAREQDSQNSLLMGLLKASQNFGAAMGGSKADTSYADAELAKGNQAVNRLKTDMDMKAQNQNILDKNKERDPKSNISLAMNDALSGMGIKIPPNTSYAEMEKFAPQLMRNKEFQMKLEEAKLKATADAEAAATTKTEKKESKDKEQKLDVQKTVDKMVNSLRNSEDFKTHTAIKTAQAALDQAILKDDKVAGGAAFMLYAKIAQGDNSVVRESDMKNLAGNWGYTNVNDMLSKLSAHSVGGKFGQEEFKRMKIVATLIQKIKAKHVREQLEPIQTRIKNHGLDPDEIISPEITREFSDAPDQESKQDPKIAQYSKDHGIEYSKAESILKKRGYNAVK